MASNSSLEQAYPSLLLKAWIQPWAGRLGGAADVKKSEKERLREEQKKKRTPPFFKSVSFCVCLRGVFLSSQHYLVSLPCTPLPRQ